jgi:hypothetical protein
MDKEITSTLLSETKNRVVVGDIDVSLIGAFAYLKKQYLI